jgi:hypothetical protein
VQFPCISASDLFVQVLSDPMPHFAKWVESPTNVGGGRTREEHLQNELDVDIGKPTAAKESEKSNLHQHEPILFSIRKTPSTFTNASNHFDSTSEQCKRSSKVQVIASQHKNNPSP